MVNMLAIMGSLVFLQCQFSCLIQTEIHILEKNTLLKSLMKKTEDSNGHGVICGSRAHLESDSIASRSLFRTILMFGFHLCVKVFGCRTIKDTQCGFKLFTRNTSRIMFKSCHIGKRHAL